MNHEAYAKMLEDELTYLRANGWVEGPLQLGSRCWSHEELGRSNLAQGHAVNFQKQLDRDGCRACFSCGARGCTLSTREYQIEYKDQKRAIEQHGWWCNACGEVLLEPEDSAALEKALVALRAEVDGHDPR